MEWALSTWIYVWSGLPQWPIQSTFFGSRGTPYANCAGRSQKTKLAHSNPFFFFFCCLNRTVKVASGLKSCFYFPLKMACRYRRARKWPIGTLHRLIERYTRLHRLTERYTGLHRLIERCTRLRAKRYRAKSWSMSILHLRLSLQASHSAEQS